MILLEIRRIVRTGKLLTGLGLLVLSLGLGVSAFCISLLIASASLASPGMRNRSYATISQESGDGVSLPISWKRFRDVEERLAGRAVVYSRPISVDMRIHQKSHSGKIAAVSQGFFEKFTFPLASGRDFTLAEATLSEARSVILSFPTAISEFGSPQNAIGGDIELQGLHYTVIGVASRAFRGVLGEEVEAWVPVHHIVPLKIRLPPGVSGSSDIWKDVALFDCLAFSDQSSSRNFASSLAVSLPLSKSGQSLLHVSQGITVTPVRDAALRKRLRLGLFLSLAFTVICSLNYSLLLLSRAPQKIEEARLKTALGASLPRLMLELLAAPASLVLVSFGLSVGIWFGSLHGLSAFQSFYQQLVYEATQAGLLTFLIQLPIACGLTVLVALLPATAVFTNSLTVAASRSTMSRRNMLLMEIPIVLQAAICCNVWIVASMLISASLAIITTPLGYDDKNLTIIQLVPRGNTIAFSSTGQNSFPAFANMRELQQHLEAFPGVDSSTFSSDGPVETERSPVAIESTDGKHAIASGYEVQISPSFFHTLKSRLLTGRTVAWYGSGSFSNEIVVNQSLARAIWGTETVLGNTVKVTHPEFAGIQSSSVEETIVGVVQDARLAGPGEISGPTFFSSISSPGATFNPVILVRGSLSVSQLRALAEKQVSSQIPELRVGSVERISGEVDSRLRPEKQRCIGAILSALLVSCISVIGFLGALTCYVDMRRRDLAVRLCLGASQQEIRRLIFVKAIRSASFAAALSLLTWPFLNLLSSTDFLGHASWSTSRALALALSSVMLAALIGVAPANAAADVVPWEVLKEQ